MESLVLADHLFQVDVGTQLLVDAACVECKKLGPGSLLIELPVLQEIAIGRLTAQNNDPILNIPASIQCPYCFHKTPSELTTRLTDLHVRSEALNEPFKSEHEKLRKDFAELGVFDLLEKNKHKLVLCTDTTSIHENRHYLLPDMDVVGYYRSEANVPRHFVSSNKKGFALKEKKLIDRYVTRKVELPFYYDDRGSFPGRNISNVIVLVRTWIHGKKFPEPSQRKQK